MPRELRLITDGPPGPTAPRFLEVEDEHGRSVDVGSWREGRDGTWELVLTARDFEP